LPPKSRRRSIGSIWDEIRFQIDKRFPPDRRTVGFVVCGFVLVVLGVFGWQAMSVRSSLNEAADQAEVLRSQIVEGDADGAQRTLAHLQDRAADAHSTSQGVLWNLSAKIPWLGRNVAAVQTVAAEMERVADGAMPPLVDLAGQLNAKAFNPDDGKVDIAAIASAAPSITEASQVLSESEKALAEVDVNGLLAPLRGPVSSAKATIGTASTVAKNADTAAALLPDMLGGDGTRRYLLLALNTAESRPTGGIVGSWGVIRANQGKIDLQSSGSTSEFAPILDPVVELTDDERSVFPSTMAIDIRDINTTPDFPRTASIAKKLFERSFDTKVDGVITVDPIALSYLLAGIGPVQVTDDAILDQYSVVGGLLHQVYIFLEQRAAQDAFFEATLDAVFEQFAAGAGDPSMTLRGIVRGVEENRIALWSTRKAEQEVIAPTDLSGDWTKDGASPRIGVFLSDAASTKMEYFLRTTTSGVSQNCLADDRQVVSITTDLTSTAPTSGLPVNVTGDGTYVEKGNMRLNVRLFSPTGGHFTSVKLDGKPMTVYADRWHDRNVTRVEVVLAPGQTKTITANVTSAAGQADDPVMTLTPGMDSQRNDFSIVSACRRD